MILLAIFCVNSVMGVTFESKKSDYANSWDRTMDFHAGQDRVLTGIADSYHDNKREDRRYKFYYADGGKVGLKCSPGSWTDWKNNWDGRLEYRCPHNQALNGVYSVHDNKREDRRFKFQCCDITTGNKFYIAHNHWTRPINDYDEKLDVKCNPNSVLTGLSSSHNNYKEDRSWALSCGIVQEAAAPILLLQQVSLSGYLNDWDRSFSYTTPTDRRFWSRHGLCLHAPGRGEDKKVMLQSCYSVSREQQWVYERSTGLIKLSGYGGKYCLDAPGTGKKPKDKVHTWRCDSKNPNQQWEYDAASGLIQQKNGGLCLHAPQRNKKGSNVQMWPCNKRDMNEWWDLSVGGSKAIVGFESRHDNHREDRRWRAYVATMPGVACKPNGWTEYQNDWDGRLSFRCPRNQVMSGFGSYHDNKREDRRYRFRCCDVSASGFHISSIRTIGRVNDWDRHMNFRCAKNEVVVGMKSHHDNKREDRLWTPECGVLTQNPPDYDDCTEVNVVDVIVGDIELGERKTNKVAKYSFPFKACGNSLTSGMSTIKIDSSEQVSTTSSLELQKSLEDTFKFSSSLETSFKFTQSSTAKIGNEAASSSATVGLEFGLKASYTSERATKIGSAETKKTETGKIDLNVVSVQNTFDPEPYQWREARANYIKQDVIVPLRMKAQCLRKDGRTKTLWVDSKLKAAAFSQVDVEFLDRTKECEQSYYKKCECATELKSNFITRDGCQTHPFHPGHPGCYVYKGNGESCGNGHGLGTMKAIPTIDQPCIDPIRCPDAKHYVDYPLDPYLWEWSYVPCGGDQFYPGDPEYEGPQVDDFVLREANKQCRNGGSGTLGDYAYESKVQAVLACDALNEEKGGTCAGVYDPHCDNTGKYYLCSNEPLKESTNSCVWKMNDQRENETSDPQRRRTTADLPKAPESLPPVVKSDMELFEEFGADMFDVTEEEDSDELETEDNFDEAADMDPNSEAVAPPPNDA